MRDLTLDRVCADRRNDYAWDRKYHDIRCAICRAAPPFSYAQTQWSIPLGRNRYKVVVSCGSAYCEAKVTEWRERQKRWNEIRSRSEHVCGDIAVYCSDCHFAFMYLEQACSRHMTKEEREAEHVHLRDLAMTEHPFFKFIKRGA